jgi:hypothetical protein
MNREVGGRGGLEMNCSKKLLTSLEFRSSVRPSILSCPLESVIK